MLLRRHKEAEIEKAKTDKVEQVEKPKKVKST